jgi:Leucine-rich repeat (LRR) protein
MLAEHHAPSAGEHPMTDRPPRRGRRRVSKEFWMLMGAILVALGWFVWVSRLAMVQHDCVAAIRRSGGRLYYDWEWASGRPLPGAQPPWLNGLMNRFPCAPDYSASIVCVSFAGTRSADVEMAILGQFASLTDLNLSWSNVTDERTVHLRGLTRLRRLDLSFTKLTGASLANLKNLAQLESLDLTSTAVADSDLAYLKELRKLQNLKLSQTDITDAGLSHLRDLPDLNRLDLSGCQTNITDAGLIVLGGLSQLESLILDDTDVTDAGLPSLSGLVQLQSLSLRNTRTGNVGISSFRTQRPEVKVMR